MQSSKSDPHNVWKRLANLLDAKQVKEFQLQISTFEANVEKLEKSQLEIATELEAILPQIEQARKSQNEMGVVIKEIITAINDCNKLFAEKEKAKADKAAFISGVQGNATLVDQKFKKLAEMRKAHKTARLDIIPSTESQIARLATVQSILTSLEADVDKIRAPQSLANKEGAVAAYNEIRVKCQGRLQESTTTIARLRAHLEVCDRARAGESNLVLAIEKCRADVEAFRSSLRAFNSGLFPKQTQAPAASSGKGDLSKPEKST